MDIPEINEDFSFNAEMKDISIKRINTALRKYAEGFDDALKLSSQFAIFLDTNILLDYYGMSQKEKKNLKEFLDKYKGRIIITKQVEKEFIRNRVSVIDDFFASIDNVRKNYEDNLIKGIRNKFKNTIENKILKYDYPHIWTEINSVFSLFETKLIENQSLKDNIEKELTKIESDNKFIKIVDDILNLYQEFQTTPELSKKEIEFLVKQYNELKNKYEGTKENLRWKVAFPGCGEKPEKDEAHGDYIIYHEIVRYMKEKNTDAIFITNDVTKNDWIQKDLQPFIHYLEKTFCLTERNLFILSGKKILPEISFEQIYITKTTRSEIEVRFYKALNSVYSYLSQLDEYQNSEFETETIINRRTKIELDIKITNEDGSIHGVEVFYISLRKSGMNIMDGIMRRLQTGKKILDSSNVDSYSVYVVADYDNDTEKIERKILDNFKMELSVDLPGRPIFLHFGILDEDKNFMYKARIK